MEDVVKFNGCKMQRVSLNNSKHSIFHFKNCDLRWSNFTNSNLLGFEFVNCDLRGVCFDFSDLSGVDFTGSKIDSSTSFIGCELLYVTGLDVSKIYTGGANVVSIMSAKRKKHHSF